MKTKQQNWYMHEADLVRMLIMEQHGGVTMDTDVHLIKPLPRSFLNIAGWTDESKTQIGGAIMAFEKGNPFLQSMLQDAIHIANSRYNKGTCDSLDFGK